MTDRWGAYVRTRESLHAVAEQVLARARYDATGRIGLEPWPGGFGTPAFDGPGGRTRVGVVGMDLVVERAGERTVERLSTVARAAELAGVAPGAPEVYPAETAVAPTEPLVVDPDAAAEVAAWFALAAHALEAWSAGLGAGAEPTATTLWPEHFDLALAAGAEPARATFGFSPGDGHEPGPYCYVAPFADPPAGSFWNATGFRGALLRQADVGGSVERAVAFLREGWLLLADTPGD